MIVNDTTSFLKQNVLRYLDLSQDRDREELTVSEIRNGIEFKGANVWILIFAVFIASLGLNTNSTAVIIGAMLISPLMGPIMGIGLGLGINDFELIKKSTRNLGIATIFSVLTSTLFFLLSPLSEASSELLARTSPTIYDVLIALFGGLAGIIAMSTKQKGHVLPGVAIATALMPPLCTAGFGLANGNMHYFLGALYLFIINSVFIAIATMGAVKVMKFSPKEFIDKKREERVQRIVYSILFLTIIPSIFITYNMVRDSYFEISANQFLNREFNNEHTQILNKHAYIKNGQRIIEVKLIGREVPADSILMAQSRLADSGLTGTDLRVSQGYRDKEVDINSLNNKMFEEIYKDGQKQIAEQQQEIATLQQELKLAHSNDSLGIALAPEMKVLFPQVKHVAISKTIINTLEQLENKTVMLVLVRYNDNMKPSENQQLKAWLQTRLNDKNIHLVVEE